MALRCAPRQTRIMNDTSPSAGQPQPPFGTGFFTWIRSLGISRGGQRWFAGVASGIAQRANIDPIIVRGIFVVLALLGGPGVLLYLAGWLLLPDIGGRIHLEEVFRGRAQTAAVVATVAVGVFVIVPMLSRLLGLTIFSSWSLWDVFGIPSWISTTFVVLAWITAMCAITYFAWQLFLKHGRNVGREGGVDQPHPTPAPSTSEGDAFPMPAAAQPTWSAPETATAPFPDPTPQPDPATESTVKLDEFAQRITDGANRFGEQANQWGERVGKQADEWSARYAKHHDAHKLGTGHTVITLAFALLAAGAAAIWALSSNASTPLLVTASLLGATVVLAVSLIIAGIRGRHTGWVGFLAFCSVIALIFTSVLPWGSRFLPFGTMEVSAGETSSGALMLAGNTNIDLTPLDRAQGTGESRDLTVWHLAGNASVTLPETAPVVVKVYVLAGNITAPHSSLLGITGKTTKISGPLLSHTFETHPSSSDATRVSIYMLAGNVRIEDTPLKQRLIDQVNPKEIRDHLEREISRLRSEEYSLLTELSQPGLSDARTERLEHSLESTRDEISELEKGLVR